MVVNEFQVGKGQGTSIGRTSPKPNRDLEGIMAQFSSRQLDLIMSNTTSIQLTEGCSIACSFCFLDAKPFVREYIPFDILKFIADKFGARFPKDFSLYHASDPFDYDFEGHDYVEVHGLFQDAMGSTPSVSTAVPKGKEDLVIRLLMDPIAVSAESDPKMQIWAASRIINRISVSYMNYKRLKEAFSRNFPYLDLSKQLVGEYRIGEYESGRDPQGLRYILYPVDCRVNDEHSEALFKIIGDELEYYISHNLFGNLRLLFSARDFNERLNKPKKTKGKAYFAYVGGGRFIASFEGPVNFIDIIAIFENQVRKPQIFGEKLDIDYANQKLHNLGKRHLDNLSDWSPACFHGVVIKPDGFYNVEKVRPSRQYPTGWTEERIDPDTFKVAVYKSIDVDNPRIVPYKTQTI